MIRIQTIKQRKPKRTARIRSKIHGTAKRPRMSLYRSNYALYVQFIDDATHKTLGSVSVKGKNMSASKTLAEKVLEKAKTLNIKTMVFDRGGYKYHGLVKTFVELLRNGGIQI